MSSTTMLNKISVVIIARDAEDCLPAALESCRRFAEVVVYDNGSTDRTAELAREFPNVALHQGEFIGFGPTKNKAAGLAANDWVFSLDADEQISPELTAYLESLPEPDVQFVGMVRRDNYLLGKLVDKGGWGGDWLVRFYNRQAHGFNAADVHEVVALTPESRVEKLPAPIKHDAVTRLGEFLLKTEKYSEIRREQQGKTYPPAIIVMKSGFAFLRSYILYGGFLAGWRGLAIAWGKSNGVFYKYMKRYADKQG